MIVSVRGVLLRLPCTSSSVLLSLLSPSSLRRLPPSSSSPPSVGLLASGPAPPGLAPVEQETVTREIDVKEVERERKVEGPSKNNL